MNTKKGYFYIILFLLYFIISGCTTVEVESCNRNGDCVRSKQIGPSMKVINPVIEKLNCSMIRRDYLKRGLKPPACP